MFRTQFKAINHFDKFIVIYKKWYQLSWSTLVIDPCAGSCTTLLAAANLGRRAYGFEVNKEFYRGAKEKVLRVVKPKLF